MKYVREPLYTGLVNGLYLCTRPRGPGDAVASEPRPLLQFALDGVMGDRHWGRTRVSGPRDATLYEKGLELPNRRQWSAVSLDELAIIAKRMQISSVDAADLGANISFSGIPSLTTLPPFSALVFSAVNGEQVHLIVSSENSPCGRVGAQIAARLGNPEYAGRFKPAAQGLRGILGWVDRPGTVRAGSTVEVRIPEYAAAYVAATRAQDKMLKPGFLASHETPRGKP